jgi:hypothetical protein
VGISIVDFFAKGKARMFSQAVKLKNDSAKSKILEENQGCSLFVSTYSRIID